MADRQFSPSRTLAIRSTLTRGLVTDGKHLLASARGFGNGSALFLRFPDDVQWQHTTLEPPDMAALRYAKEDSWIMLSNHTRHVGVAAQRIQAGTAENANVTAVAEALRQGATYPPLIAATDGQSGQIILIEGHTRATAYAISGIPPRMILGTSPRIHDWNYW